LGHKKPAGGLHNQSWTDVDYEEAQAESSEILVA
jgi:hypothetical protein